MHSNDSTGWLALLAPRFFRCFVIDWAIFTLGEVCWEESVFKSVGSWQEMPGGDTRSMLSVSNSLAFLDSINSSSSSRFPRTPQSPSGWDGTRCWIYIFSSTVLEVSLSQFMVDTSSSMSSCRSALALVTACFSFFVGRGSRRSHFQLFPIILKNSQMTIPYNLSLATPIKIQYQYRLSRATCFFSSSQTLCQAEIIVLVLRPPCDETNSARVLFPAVYVKFCTIKYVIIYIYHIDYTVLFFYVN